MNCLGRMRTFGKVLQDLVAWPDGGVIAITSYKFIEFWDVVNVRCRTILHMSTFAVCAGPQQTLIVARNDQNSLAVYKITESSIKYVRELIAHTDKDWVNKTMLFLEDGLLLSCCFGFTGRVWDVTTGECLALVENLVQDCVVRTKGGGFISTFNNSTDLYLWQRSVNTPSSTFRMSFTSSFIPCTTGTILLELPNGNIVCGSTGCVSILDVPSRQYVRVVPVRCTDLITLLVLAPDSLNLISYAKDGRLCVTPLHEQRSYSICAGSYNREFSPMTRITDCITRRIAFPFSLRIKGKILIPECVIVLPVSFLWLTLFILCFILFFQLYFDFISSALAISLRRLLGSPSFFSDSILKHVTLLIRTLIHLTFTVICQALYRESLYGLFSFNQA